MNQNHIPYDTIPTEITDAQQVAHDLLTTLQEPTPDKTAVKALQRRFGSAAEEASRAQAVLAAERVWNATMQGKAAPAPDIDAIKDFTNSSERHALVAERWQPATYWQDWLIEGLDSAQSGDDAYRSRRSWQIPPCASTGLGTGDRHPMARAGWQHAAPRGRYGGDFVPLQPVPIIYATWEDSPAQIQGRLQWMNNGYEADAHFYGVDMRPHGAMWAGASAGQAPGLTKAGVELRAEVERLGAKLLVVDTLGVANRASEIDRAEVGAFFADFSYAADTGGCSVLLVAHPPKTNELYSGSTGMLGGVRALLTLERIETKCEHSAHSDGEPCVKPHAFRLRNAKQNYAPDANRAIWLRNDRGIWVEEAYPNWIKDDQSYDYSRDG